MNVQPSPAAETPPADSHAAPFGQVYRDEWKEIRERRSKQLYEDAGLPGKPGAPPDNLTGLALSGGGIRSATFCLGLLQGLHKLNLLRAFDYLSTVSGGGYVGGWWSAWLSRDQINSQIYQLGQDEEDFALLCVEDIKNPVGLIIKLRDGADKVSVGLCRRLSKEARLLLEGYDERKAGEEETEELREILVKELNLAIADRFFSDPENEGTPHPEAGAHTASKSAGERRFAEHSMWANRLLLEEAYPCEFKDIFPPREQIEMERFPAYVAPKEAPEPEAPGATENGLSQESERGVESSMNAWRDPIHHLRLYANYLTPRKGLLSYDTWRAVSVVTRNLTMTWLVLLPVLTAVMLLGQLYFAQDEGVFLKFLGHGELKEDVFTRRMLLIAAPVGALLGLIGVLCLAWMLCLNDRSSASDRSLQIICLSAVLVLAGLFISAVAGPWLMSLGDWHMGWPFLAWLAVACALFCYVMVWPVKVGEVPGNDAALRKQWAREVRRGKISRIHTKLLVWVAVVAAVLLLAGFGHEFFDYLFSLKESTPSNWSSLKLGSLIPLLGAIGGSIFTAVKAAPTADDKGQRREPSFVARLIFAVTPGLVVVMLALAVTWAAHEVLGYLFLQEATIDPVTGEVVPARLVNRFSPYPRAFTVVVGTMLCFALAVYEMKWQERLRTSWTLFFFVSLLATSLSWAVPVAGPYLLNRDNLLVSSMVVVVIVAILLIVFQRVNFKETWQQLGASALTPEVASERGSARLGMFSLFFSMLFFMIGIVLALDDGADPSKFEGDGPKFFLLVLPVVVTCLTGGMILFRMLVVRKADDEAPFELRVLRETALGRGPRALSRVRLACFLLPFVVASWLNVTLMSRSHPPEHAVGLVALPLLLVALLGGVVIFRAMALTDRQRPPKTRLGPFRAVYVSPLRVAAALFDQHFSRYGLLSKLAGLLGRHRGKIQIITAASSILLAAQAGLGLRKWWVEEPMILHSLALTDSPLSAGAVLCVSLMLLWMSVGGAEQVAGARPALSAPPPAERRWLQRHSRGIAWLLALCCVGLGLLIGLLIDTSFGHIREQVSSSSAFVSNGIIAGMVACLILAAFEMKWGLGDNRRSLWLLAGAYVTLTMVFVASHIPAEDYQAFGILRSVFGLIAAVLVWVVALGWMVDPNSVSMHQFYKGRLVRAYLGASNIKRRKQQKEIAESAADDDLYLSGLKNCQRGAPYHLVNATLNLVAGRDLATAQRSASSFVLSKGYCGSLRTRYRPTKDYMKGRLSLGTAIAASGAAVSPNMGSKKPTSALAMLLTLLNVRLGYWAPTPNREYWQMSQPRLWPFYLLREFLSQTNDLSSYCYLTDGGHFDNTGLYSLVERGCRNVVMVDCGADPLPSCFQDLGDAIRRCRIDFGTEVKLNLTPFIETEESLAGQYFVVGGIRYSRKHAKALGWELHPDEDSDEDKAKRTGTLIYFKPSIVGRETADVRQYAIENKHFPQQTTANQWFDEAQFESYRRLGQLCAKQAFGRLEAVRRFNTALRPTPGMVEEIFKEAKVKFTLPADLTPECG